MSDPHDFSGPDLRVLKHQLRQRMELCRRQARAKDPEAPHKLRDQFLASVKIPEKGVVAGYYAQGSEMDPGPLLIALREKGYDIALPVIVGPNRPLIFRLYKSGDQLVQGLKHIPEPRPAAQIVVPDVLLVPLLAFNRQGARLGYGGGYYDRTLNQLRRLKPMFAAGIAYACQEFDDVPTGMRDAPLDALVTDKEALTL